MEKMEGFNALDEEESLERAKDKLTNLLTAREAQREIEQYVQKDEKNRGIIFLIDVDDLYKINNLYGCFFGDVVLQEIAQVLTDISEKKGVVSRYEGDGFLFFREGLSLKESYQIGEAICKAVEGLYVNSVGTSVLSCSIGIGRIEKGISIAKSLKLTEKALKYAKNKQSKNVISWKDVPQDISKSKGLEKYYEDYSFEMIFSEKSKKILDFAKKILEGSKSFKLAVGILFSRLGREYGLKRIGMLDLDYDFLSGRIVYQWKREDIKTDISKKVLIYDGDYEYLQEGFKENGWMIVDNKDGGEHAKWTDSLHQISVLINEMYWQKNRALLLFYECEDNGIGWPKEICLLFKEISSMLGVYHKRENMNREMKEKAEFLSGISHEIRTPMNAIYGWTKIARKNSHDCEKMKECLDKINSSSKYLMSIMDEILDVENISSGITEVVKEEFSINEVFESVKYLFQREFMEKGIHLSLANQCKDEYFYGDKKHIQQVLVNVLEYVSKVTLTEETIILHAMEMMQKKNTQLNFSIESMGEYGDSYDLAYLRKSLSSNDGSEKLKLGDLAFPLFLSYRYVEKMGGHMEIGECQDNFELAFSVPVTCVEKKIEKEQKNYNFSGRRLLLVEDNNLNVEVAQTLLEMVGFEVDVAENGKIAVDKFKQRKEGSYDAILMDIRMPIMDGLEATRRIRNLGKKDSRTVSIVALSANAHDEDAKKSIENGMNGHLAKPIDVDNLYRMLDQLITKSSWT